MILFIFEGNKREPDLFGTLKYLFFPKTSDTFIYSYGNNIYDLYQKLKGYDIIGTDGGDGDVVAVLNEILMKKGKKNLEGKKSSDFSEIYLFFDYDFHDRNFSLPENNVKLKEMLDFFNNETENGKLYVNYPMVDSIRYTKQLPDANYYSYTVKRNDCKHFKRIADEFSYYKSFDFILFDFRTLPTEKKAEFVKRNWEYLKEQNVSKANFICTDNYSIPLNKDDIAQASIFDAQLRKYVNTDHCNVAILNAFPIFLYEYFK